MVEAPRNDSSFIGWLKPNVLKGGEGLAKTSSGQPINMALRLGTDSATLSSKALNRTPEENLAVYKDIQPSLRDLTKGLVKGGGGALIGGAAIFAATGIGAVVLGLGGAALMISGAGDGLKFGIESQAKGDSFKDLVVSVNDMDPNKRDAFLGRLSESDPSLYSKLSKATGFTYSGK